MNYKEKLEEAKRLYQTANQDQKYVLESLFHELKESDDERIRKRIINTLNRDKILTEDEAYDCVAWLEKQGEHANFCSKIQVGDKVARNEDGVLVNLSQLIRVAKKDEKQGEQKPAHEIEPIPIFRIGDILKRKGRDYTFKVDRIQGGYYHCDRNNGAFFPIEEQDNWELIEQKPAWSEDDQEMLDTLIANYKFLSKEFRDKEHNFFVGMSLVKEDLDMIEWLKSLKDRVQPQQEWSEEDEKMLEDIVSSINHESVIEGLKCRGINYSLDTSARLMENLINWLKSLKNRVQPKNEWSDKDEEIIRSLLDIIYECHSYGKCALKLNEYSKLCDWLNSLKDRYTWKPSDEQMNALDSTLQYSQVSHNSFEYLNSLFNDLKKLKVD